MTIFLEDNCIFSIWYFVGNIRESAAYNKPNVYSGFFVVNYFRMDHMKRKIMRAVLLFAGVLLFGIGMSIALERRAAVSKPAVQGQTVAEQTSASEKQGQDAQTALQKDEEIKKVALTFDDGPNPDYTGMLLDGLKERGVRATFFVLGSEVELYPQLVRRASREGHLIGVHAYKHVNLRQLGDAEAVEQIDRTNGAIYRATGQYASYIRPPYGCWKEDLDYEVQMVEVLWDIDPRDWATTSSDLVVQRVLNEVEEDSIILLHDASESSVQAAFTIIDALQEQGYTFVTVEELLLE